MSPSGLMPGGILNNGVSYKWSSTLHLEEDTHLIFYFYRSPGYNVRRTHNTKCHSHVKCIFTLDGECPSERPLLSCCWIVYT